VVGTIWLRRVAHRSGVTDIEARAALAGDDLVPEPMWQSTHGITSTRRQKQSGRDVLKQFFGLGEGGGINTGSG
jgi:hypothetical protein